MLRINESFAKKYEDYRRKEELQKFKDRYGDVKLSDAKKALGKQADGNPAALSQGDNASSPSASSSSSSESEDSECEGWTPGMEAGFLRVYSALQSGDSRLLDPGVSWFPEEQVAREAESANQQHKPMYYNEYHRNYLLTGAYEKDDGEIAGAGEAKAADLAEAERIRDLLAKSHAKESDSGRSSEVDETGGDDADFLVKRPRVAAASEESDPMLRIHKFVRDPSDQGGGLELEPGWKNDLAKLKRHWTDDQSLTEAERYLRDYITKEFWRPRQQQHPSQRSQKSAVSMGEDGAEERLSDDEAFLARQSAFESRWNLRTDNGAEADPEFESEYKRTLASGEAADEIEEDDDDDELFVVKAKKARFTQPDVEEEDAEVVKELNRLEKRRQWKRQDADGENDEDGAADEEEEKKQLGKQANTVRTYPRRIAESLRQATDETDRTQRRAERRERRRQEKLARRRELDKLVAMKEAELERRLERLRRNAGAAVSSDRMAEALGGDFLDADFDSDEHDKRMADLFSDQFYDGDDEKKPRFSDDEGGGGDEEEEEEDEVEAARRLRDEVDGLRAEDLIRAGPGEADLRCRFNYRQTEPNDFGLDPVEILLADDRELNAWCSVRKTSQYREREADWRDRRRYRSAKSQERKARLMPDMVKRLEAAAAYPDARAWARALDGGQTASGIGEAESDAAEAGNARQRRRKKKKRMLQLMKKQQQQQEQEKQEEQRSPDSLDEVAPRCRKKSKERQQRQEKQKTKKKQKTGVKKDRLQISEQRLLELGIDPRKFRRIKREEGGAKR